MEQQYGDYQGQRYEEQGNNQQQLPDFAQVEGTTVKLSGLDYSLVRQQTVKNKKKNFLQSIKNKIGQFNHKIPLTQTPLNQSKTVQNDELTRKIQMVGKTKPLINTSSFYLFPLQSNFSSHSPQIFSRRVGRMHSLPLFINHDLKQIETFKQLIIEDEKVKKMNKIRHNQVKKIVPQLADQSDSEDEQFINQYSIFGDDNEDEKKDKVDIEVGRTLNLGVNEDDIFNRKGYKQTVRQQQQKRKQPQKDKYQFLRKKIKVNEDAYGQCFPQSDI